MLKYTVTPTTLIPKVKGRGLVYFNHIGSQCFRCFDPLEDINNIHLVLKRNQHFKKLFIFSALAGVAQWIECRPVNQKGTGSIPSQGTCLACRPGPWLGVYKRQLMDVSLSHRCFSPSLSPFLPFSLKVNKYFKK